MDDPRLQSPDDVEIISDTHPSILPGNYHTCTCIYTLLDETRLHTPCTVLCMVALKSVYMYVYVHVYMHIIIIIICLYIIIIVASQSPLARTA